MSPAPARQSVEISGVVARVIHHDKNKCFCILSVDTEGLGRIKVIGAVFTGDLGVGSTVECTAVFDSNPTYGDQYKAGKIQTTPPPAQAKPQAAAAKPGQQQAQPAAAGVSIAGRVARVIHHNTETCFCSLVVDNEVVGRQVKVAGLLAVGSISPGDLVECVATLEAGNKFGEQFKSDLIMTTPPRTAEGIERYLASGVVSGIGPALAKRLVKAFGAQVVEIIDQQPERLLEIPGLGKTRVQALREAWADQRQIREILIFLRSYGLGAATAVKVQKAYGDRAIAMIQDDPYRLSRDIRGIGFKVADQIATNLGTAFDSPKRARAGIVHVMGERSIQGHCAAAPDELIQEASDLLGRPAKEILTKAVAACLESEELTFDRANQLLYLTELFEAEVSVAGDLALLMGRATPPWGEIDPKWAVRWAEAHTGLTLAPSQREALLLAVSSKVAIITGGPGTGKTTLLNGILGIVKANSASVTLCAPTGRAAKRLEESTGLEAKTIHRTLEFDPINFGFKRGPNNPLDTDLVVVDEASMVDVTLMASLLEAIPPSAALLIVGDQDQLPSVGPGSVLGDLIESKAVPVVRLTEIFRQAEGSLIVRNAHLINQGKLPESAPDKTHSDFFVLQAESSEEVQQVLIDLVTKHIPARYGLDPAVDVQVLTPMHKGTLGTRTLNNTLRGLLNPEGGPKIVRFGTEFAVGDKVLQTVNDYKKDVFNGDVGTITKVDLEMGKVVVEFDGVPVEYAAKDLDNLTLAYAMTIHKSQGSEYPAVVIPLAGEQTIMLERSLLYTAVTRGKSLVFLVCQPNALDRAVKSHRARTRVTGLKKRVVAAVS